MRSAKCMCGWAAGQRAKTWSPCERCSRLISATSRSLDFAGPGPLNSLQPDSSSPKCGPATVLNMHSRAPPRAVARVTDDGRLSSVPPTSECSLHWCHTVYSHPLHSRQPYDTPTAHTPSAHLRVRPVRLLHQQHAVRPPPQRVRQQPAAAVPNIPGRGAHQPRHGCTAAVLAAVQLQQRGGLVIQLLGQGLCGRGIGGVGQGRGSLRQANLNP